MANRFEIFCPNCGDVLIARPERPHSDKILAIAGARVTEICCVRCDEVVRTYASFEALEDSVSLTHDYVHMPNQPSMALIADLQQTVFENDDVEIGYGLALRCYERIFELLRDQGTTIDPD